MRKPRICVTIVEDNLEAVREIEPRVQLFEVRMDLVGPGWTELVKYLRKPWIACNRSPAEGGRGEADDLKRAEELLRAAETGASIVDIEFGSQNLADVVPLIKGRAECLISFHDLLKTPSYETLKGIAESQIKAGADICKIVTTAQRFEDNLTVLRLIPALPETRLVAFAMGEEGRISRILSPLAGGYFTYACIQEGKESAAGQIPLEEMIEIYRYLK